MKRKTWVLTLVAIGLVVAATSAAFNLHPSTWFSKKTPSTPAATTPASKTDVPAREEPSR